MIRRLLIVIASAALLSGMAIAQPVSVVPAGAAPSIQPDLDVEFDSGGVTVHASVRLPAPGSTDVPGVVIIGGSGNLDRDGASPGFPEPLDPYLWMADRLSEQGVASIRYDKLGTGATGLGPYASDPSALLTKSYDELRVQPARDALAFLARQSGIDPTRLIVVGHSEGGMVALAVDRNPGNAARPAGLALIEPQYTRILDIISIQLSDVVETSVGQGTVTPGDAATLVDWLNTGIAEIRSTNPPFPDPGPDPLPGATGVTAALQAAIRASVYSSDPTTMLQTQAMWTLFGKGADELDPVVLAGSVSVPTLITCGTRDIETPCEPGGPSGSGVSALAGALPSATTTLVVAPGTEHFLRDIGADNPTSAELAAYPYSADIELALTTFVAQFVPLAPTPSPPLPVPPPAARAVVVTPTFTG